jgi:hypothetical protein
LATFSRPFQGATRSRRVAGSVAALFLAIGGLLPLSAGIVQAHNLAASFACSDANPSVPVLSVAMGDFSTGVINSIMVTIDGTVVLPTTTFTTAYSNTFPGGDPTAAHTAVVTVLAGDDPTGSLGYTRTFNLSVDACQDATPTPPTTTPSTAPSIAPSSSPSGGVLAATSRPHPTVPATSTTDQGTPSSPTSSIGFLLILFAVVVLVVGFAPLPTKRRAISPSARCRRR